MNKNATPGYYLLRTYTWVIQLFPLRVHYFFSNLMYFLIYYIFRYRRKVVLKNLTNSFPEKTKAEIKQIERKFYSFFCDCLVETFYYDRVSEEEIKKRHSVLNFELVEKYLAENRPVILVFAHYNNWEWNCSLKLHSKYSGNVVYKKLTNSSFDRFYFNLRGQFGIRPIEKSDTYRQLIADLHDKKSAATAFLMDQSPRKNEIKYWTTFLNQDTPVVTGTEKISRKLDAAVIFCNTRKLTRGYNRLEFKLIAEHAKNTAPFEITEKATRMIEEMIVECPEYWLWSHKRWKHKRVEG
jgi:KDO2-lipid IV(A) lauroyltransferase